jgi:(2R)-3-sulfolactate dehydrogenase (NADP+)
MPAPPGPADAAAATVGGARRLAAGLLEAAGLAPGRAETSALCIVLADAWGVGTHGLLRLPYYLRRMLAGGYPPDAELATLTDTGPVLALDGGGGLGHWQLWHAAQEAARRCGRYGIAAVSVANSGHCGALGVYTVPGLEAGMLTLVFSHGPAVMPAWGSSDPLLSTSPLAAGVPARPRPVIVDMATTTVARGKIAALARRGEAVPPGWALDASGRPTTDAAEALAGLLSPLGGAKGFALALVVEALAACLAGPKPSPEVADMFAADAAARPQGLGHLLVTFDPGRFGRRPGEAQARLDQLAAAVAAHGGRLPGAGRRLPADLDPATPLDVAEDTRRELAALARELGVADRLSPQDVQWLDANGHRQQHDRHRKNKRRPCNRGPSSPFIHIFSLIAHRPNIR